MAQRRMISKSISVSRKLSKVSNFEALLFTWLIPHCDDYGRMDALPQLVKGIVVPIRPETVEEVAKALDMLESVGLVTRYTVEGEQYLQIYAWDDHQTFKNDRPRNAMYPAPEPTGIQRNPNGTNRNPDGKIVLAKLSEVKLSEVNNSVRPGFDAFWASYPRKINKKGAARSWNRIAKGTSTSAILAALEAHKRSDQWTKDDGRFIPHPATWLNQERWNDELRGAKASSGKFSSIRTTKV